MPNSKATKVHTGIALEVPSGHVGKIYLRSSTGANTKIRLANGTGIIDSDYRGELILLCENIGDGPVSLFSGDRIAQILIEPLANVTFKEVKELSETEREGPKV